MSGFITGVLYVFNFFNFTITIAMQRIRIRYKLLFIFIIVGNFFGLAANATPLSENIRVLRDQKSVAEDLVYTIKAKYKPNTTEYNAAKQLYETTALEYNRFIDELILTLSHEELKELDLKPSAERASTAAKNFQSYVSSHTKTLGGFGFFGLVDDLLNAAERILKGWLKLYESEREEAKLLATELRRVLPWKSWKDVS